MNARIRPILLLAGISVLLVFGQRPCRGTIRDHRKKHETIMNQAREQLSVKPEAKRVTSPPRVAHMPAVLVQPVESPTGRVGILKEQIDGLLAERRTDPNEIAALKREWDEVARQEDSGVEPSLYQNTSEKLDIAYAYAEAIDEKQRLYESNLNDLDENFDATANTGETAKSLFNASFIANIVIILGLLTRIGNISSSKLDRQLKLLQIAEKKAQLEQDGISLD